MTSPALTSSLDRPTLEPMLWASSVAVVGASPRRPSVGNRVMTELLGGGFEGRVIPVTPTHSEVEGIPTVPSLAEVDAPPDLVILAVGDRRLEEQLDLAIERSARAVALFSPAEGEAEGGGPLRERLKEMAVAAGLPVCGPNGMGFVNVTHRLRATGYFLPPHLEPGPISFLSHSGSLFAAMLHNRRQLHFNLVVSTGQEINTTMADYLHHVLDLDSTRVVGLFMETVRDPTAMAEALNRASRSDVPVVALKVGRTEGGRAAAATHSGALAGEDLAYEAFFEAHGVHRVETMDQMADTLEIFSTGRRPRRGGLGAVLDSGGERTLLIDSADEVGVELARLSAATKERVASVLERGLEPDNPVDAWGTGHGHEEIFSTALEAVGSDPAVGAVAFGIDLTLEEDPAESYLGVISRVQGRLEVPLVVMAHLASGIDPVQAAQVRAAGVPVLEGTRTGLEAIKHFLAHVAFLPPPGPHQPPAAAVRRRWRARLSEGRPLTEDEGLDLIAAYGVPVVAHRPAADLSEALTVARALGYPVAVKALSATHKTDVGGVHLDVRTPAELEKAVADITDRLGSEVLVQSMAPAGVEVALGMVRDPQFGPLLVVGAGGTLVEFLSDRKMALPPVDAPRAELLVEGLRLAPLLAGTRGKSPVDRGALIEAIVSLSTLAMDLGDLIFELDVNPVIVSPGGAVAVDALVIPGKPG